MSTSRAKLALLGVTAAGLIAVAAILVWLYVLRPSLEVSDLRPGESVTLRSGISFTVPQQATGSFSKWRSKDAKLNNPLGLSEMVVLTLPGAHGETVIGIDAYWATDDAVGPLVDLERGTQLATESDDSTVEVRWCEPRLGNFNLFIFTRLPGLLPGVITAESADADDATGAWHAATEVWQLLHITELELPPPPVLSET